MNSTQITTAARRIARRHNEKHAAGMGGNGKLVFGRDGSGGYWHSDNAYGFGRNCIVAPMSWACITAADAQEMLDERGAE
jgi:hypothetical protein